ncbi:hypothetical protein [Lacticaseibacillus nasuensis]|nr:hypothetical protein [Lacticaseibacillus nasuensis]
MSYPGAREGWNDGLAVAAILTDMELTALIAQTRQNEAWAIDSEDSTEWDTNFIGGKRSALELIQAERERKRHDRENIEGR